MQEYVLFDLKPCHFYLDIHIELLKKAQVVKHLHTKAKMRQAGVKNNCF